MVTIAPIHHHHCHHHHRRRHRRRLHHQLLCLYYVDVLASVAVFANCSAEAETKAKLEKVAEIKRINSQIMAIKSEISKYEDTLKEYQLYKRFLFSVTPKVSLSST